MQRTLIMATPELDQREVPLTQGFTVVPELDSMVLRSSIKRASCWILSVMITCSRLSSYLTWMPKRRWKSLLRSSQQSNITHNQILDIWIFRKRHLMNKLLLTAGPIITKYRTVDLAPGRVKWETPFRSPSLKQTRSSQVSQTPSLGAHNSLQTHCNNYRYSPTTIMLGASLQLGAKFLDSAALICKPTKSTIRRMFIPLWIYQEIRPLTLKDKTSMLDKNCNQILTNT